LAKLPSVRALEGLADIYSRHATEPPDRLRAAALAILVVTGFRIGELLTLPKDCEVEEERGGKPRYGLRYYREKSRGGARMLAVRWLTLVGAELARQAIAEIREITQSAREQAVELEANPNHVSIPGFSWNDRMTRDEVARALGYKHRDSLWGITGKKLRRYEDERGFYYRAADVEAYLLRERVPHLWTLDRRDGTKQMLSETLLIAHKNFFHSVKSTYPLLVEPVVYSHLCDFLSGHKSGAKSAFERFGIREADGSFCRMASHQFRHWLNDIADKGGLPVELQTRWLGRENAKDTESYRHATIDERLQWVKQGIREGAFSGAMAEVYFALPAKERDVFLEGQLRSVHFTPVGLCLHDLATDPCPYHVICVRGCPDYLRTKGNQQERANLIQMQQNTKQALTSIKNQSEGQTAIAQSWIRSHEELLAGIRAALAVDNDQTNKDGARLRPFAGKPQRFAAKKK
jgi:hypothetical protein